MTDPSLRSLSHAVDGRVIVKYLGMLSLSLAAMAAVPAAVAAALGEVTAAERYASVFAVLLLAGFLGSRRAAAADIQINEGLVIVALTFILGALVMTWPFMSAGLSLIDALFEAVSGLTTTGLSTLPSVEHMPASFLFTRSWLQWYGGLVIIVVALAVIIGPSAGARRLAVDEGDAAEGVASTRMRARSVLKVYVALTLAGIVLTWLAGATPTDALIHTLSAISTGGFSNHDASAGGLGAPAAATVSLISLIGAISLSLQASAIRNPRLLWSDGEVRAIVAVVLLTAAALMACMSAKSGLSLGGIGEALFLAVSSQTTSGFALTPIAALAPAAKLVLIFSMLIGGDMGSTAGGIKIFRLLVIGRVLQLLLVRTCIANHAVVTPRVAGRIVGDEEIRVACGIVAAYAAVILVSWFVFVAWGLAPLDALFDVVSAAATVGLSTGVTSASLPAALKGLLCIDMLMGRLEIIAVLVLVYPRTWLGRRAARP
ncbi:MAG: TrkH family potassium uptake protein [Rhodospirillales bacterium]|nr:TrkH family potassium uptake protein [Rhodospirillales bacterium]